MGVNDITSLIDKYGIKGAIFIIFLFLIIAIFKSKWFIGILSKISDKFIEKFMKNKTKDSNTVRNINESDISNHDVFNYIDFWMYSKVPTFQFKTDFRTIVFRKYLTLYLKSYKDNIDKYVKGKEYQDMDEAKLSTSLLNMINMIVYDYETLMRDIGLPDVVIERMKIKNNDTITLTIDLIEGICSSQFYSSDKNFLKVYSILNILLSVLENTISNSEGVCNSINGQLKGYQFGGKIEP